MENQNRIVEKFYEAFANHNAAMMSECYHPDIEFSDPVFGTLKGVDVSDMWTMLILRSKGNLKISFSDITYDGNFGRANWVAEYLFSKTGRNVVNEIEAYFQFRDGLIVRHSDSFNLWKWSRQAFGFKGLLFGWTGFMQNKIQTQAKRSLAAYQQNVR